MSSLLLLLLSRVVLAGPPVVHVDRAGRVAYVLDAQGGVLHQEAAGIGRGGQGTKTSMADLITPTGTFTVDLILTPDGSHSAVSAAALARFSGEPAYRALLADVPGRVALLANMNGLDFDGDGQADGAYGSAYIGLDAAAGAGAVVTGPKMRRYRDGTPYWFSIALHGTPDPGNLGAANSGGCVHLSPPLLARLVAEGHVTLGSTVIIADGPPR